MDPNGHLLAGKMMHFFIKFEVPQRQSDLWEQKTCRLFCWFDRIHPSIDPLGSGGDSFR
jgi:hypothetical protein